VRRFFFALFLPSWRVSGPYTSYDINTLIRATAGDRKDVLFSTSDDMSQEQTSRITLADACVCALRIGDGDNGLMNRTLSIANVEGPGGQGAPGLDTEAWMQRIASARR